MRAGSHPCVCGLGGDCAVPPHCAPAGLSPRWYVFATVCVSCTVYGIRTEVDNVLLTFSNRPKLLVIQNRMTNEHLGRTARLAAANIMADTPPWAKELMDNVTAWRAEAAVKKKAMKAEAPEPTAKASPRTVRKPRKQYTLAHTFIPVGANAQLMDDFQETVAELLRCEGICQKLHARHTTCPLRC